ncbi:hypothetical protein PN36_20950 [Candidatus Thiomargarita nelsonii]|uniref:VWFA domain-containing protein n=1 Tax=Candidatus Thiomargarita nelsonii TaxID=1003181 RepID=A0A4E0QU01_9GAMM|nr:hypothetical protein PN36_20950 [Candidatus Thiomargarita nelsonii]
MKNVDRFLSIVLVMSLALVGVSCQAQQSYQNQSAAPQSKYAITFTEFVVKKEDFLEKGDSDYLFYVYNPEKNTYKQKCFNHITGCNNNVSTNKGNTVRLDVTVSNLTASHFVYLMVLEDDSYWNVLNKTADVSDEIIKPELVYFKRQKWYCSFEKPCLKIPVQYLLKHKDSCLTMKTDSGSNEICLHYEIKEIKPPQKLHSNFKSNLEALSALSGLFDGKNLVNFYLGQRDYNGGQEVKFHEFSDAATSVTLYANGQKFDNLPLKIAKPVVDYLADKYPTGLWVINGGEYGNALAAYGADQLDKTGSAPPQIRVTWPKGVSEKSINDWLKTPAKGQSTRPYHTIKVSYQKGEHTIDRVTGLSDNKDTVSNTLTLPGRYTLGKHLNIGQVELSGIFSLFKKKSEVKANKITLTLPKEKFKAKLNLPSGYDKNDCIPISKTVKKWFTTDKVRLRCPRLPKSRIQPDFADGEVSLDAQHKKLSLGLRFKNRDQSSLEGWQIESSNITLTKQGQDGWFLVDARQLPELKSYKDTLTLVPPKEDFSIFYLNEPIKVKLSKAQWKYIYTAKTTTVPDGDNVADIKIEVPNPKLRPVETFKNSANPWTPEKLTFLCDGSQSDTSPSLCGTTCRLGSKKAKNKSVQLICNKKAVTIPLKNLEGYLITSQFLGQRWGTPSVRLKDQALTDFFCGAWQRLFPVHNQVIVVGKKDQKSGDVQVAKLSNMTLPRNPKQRQTLSLATITADKKPIWSYPLQLGDNKNSIFWQLDSVVGRYDYYIHGDSKYKANGELLKNLSIRPGAICRAPSQDNSPPVAQAVSYMAPQPSYSPNQGDKAQIDIVAVFADNYNFQQQPVRRTFSLPGLPQTGKQELRAGWMRKWNKHDTQQSLRSSHFNRQTKRNPSVKLHYYYDDDTDRQDKWLWNPNRTQALLEQAPQIDTRNNMANLVDITNVVLNNGIQPNSRHLNNQIQKIIKHVTAQWDVNNEYLLVILSDGISEQEMEKIKKISLPRGNGKRRLLILTSEFLSPNSTSIIALPKLPSYTGGHTVISMYDDNWIEQFVNAIFNF